MKNIFEVLRETTFPDNQVIFEIGAADGEDSPRIMEATRFKSGSYFAIEPEIENLKVLKQRPCLQGIGCHVLPLAIGNETRLCDFNRSKGTPQSGSLKKPVKHLEVFPWCTFEEIVQVPMVKLDDLAKLFAINRVDFVWADIQGAEDWMIEGAQSILRRTRFLYTEYNNEELYQGQLNSESIMSKLPGNWKVSVKWDNDVLFEQVDQTTLDKPTQQA